MLKFLRPLAVLFFLGTAVYAGPTPPVFYPTCFNLPACQFPDVTWTFSHQCKCPASGSLPNCPANQIRYVYKKGSAQCLYQSAILP